MVYNVLAVAAAAALVSASPVQQRSEQTVTLPLTHVKAVTDVKNIVAKGTAKLAHVNSGASAFSNLVSSGPATNDVVSYVASVTIGGAAQSLIVDTGSSNTWCGANRACEKTATGVSTGRSVSVSYGSGSFSGTEYTDNVSYGGLTVTAQSIGSASTSTGFSGVNGIIGFGPVGLTAGTVSGQTNVPTFTNNLRTQGKITTEVLGVYFKPESGADTNDANGELTLGGTDTTKYTGALTYFPRLTSGTASAYWGITVAAFTYGSTTLGSGSGIVDTGTTLIYIPTTAYNAFISATGGRLDANSGLVSFTTKPTANFGIRFGSTTYTLTPAQYLVPTAEYSFFGLTTGRYYAWITNGGSSGVNTIIGQKFLENYYSVFDTTNSRIGFATRA